MKKQDFCYKNPDKIYIIPRFVENLTNHLSVNFVSYSNNYVTYIVGLFSTFALQDWNKK